MQRGQRNLVAQKCQSLIEPDRTYFLVGYVVPIDDPSQDWNTHPSRQMGPSITDLWQAGR
jgi:hypothetical protein